MKKVNFKKINQLILEALKDELPPYFIERIKELFPDNYKEYLDKEVKKTDEIPEGKWAMSDTDKKNIIRIYFGIDVAYIKSLILTFYRSTDVHFWLAYKKSLVDPNTKITFKDPWIDDIEKLYTNFLYKISVSETKSTELVLRDQTGQPILKNGVIKKKKKKAGELVLSKNIVNFSTWIESYNLAYPNKKIINVYNDAEFTKINAQIKENNMDVKLFNDRKMYVYITKDPSATLRKSVSVFYDSCRNIFKSGVQDIMYDVLDYNCKVGFIIFDSPFVDERSGQQHPYTPFARSIIRITDKGIVFDRVYNQHLNRFEVPVAKIISKYSGIKPVNLSDSELHSANAIYDYSPLKNAGSPYVEKFQKRLVLRNKKDQMELASRDPYKFLAQYVGITNYKIYDEAINLALENFDVDSSNVVYNNIFKNLFDKKVLDDNLLKKFLLKSKYRTTLLMRYYDQTGQLPSLQLLSSAIQQLPKVLNSNRNTKVYRDFIKSNLFHAYGNKAINLLLKQYPQSIVDIPNPTPEQVNYVLKKDPALILSLPNPTSEQILDAINRNKKLAVFIFSHFTHLKNNAGLINDLLRKESWLIQFIEKPTKEQIEIAINKEPSLMRVINVPKSLKERMINSDPMNIKYVKDPQPDLQMLAVRLNKNAYKFIDNPDQNVTNYYNQH